ncbi:MAG: hypothetical protein M1818_007156 [Claussenomyces sp. TS43310]|nr:MAG: hypothetical protein M1818_007156 [Claussenomyces sp. TS43310]
MPTDRLLTTVLGAYQNIHHPEQTHRILSTTTSLLTTLSNPLNITLLTSQLLTAPTVWSQVNDLHSCLQIISVFNTAAITVRQHGLTGKTSGQPRQNGGVGCDDWARAIVKGADRRSARWQHLLAIGGVLLGMEDKERQSLSPGLRSTLEAALVTATNLALDEPARNGKLGTDAIVLVLNHTFPLLSTARSKDLNYDTLAPIMVRAMIQSEGYQEGLFLGVVDIDVGQVPDKRLDWSANSSSFFQVQKLLSKPLIASVGPLARLVAQAVQNLSNSTTVCLILDDLDTFAESLIKQWRQNKLSEIHSTEESIRLTSETTRVTLPLLWQILKTAMFSITVILGAIIGRTLVDQYLASDVLAPSIASKTLHILRSIHFITSRLGTNAFSAYSFVSLTSLDILLRYPARARDFLSSIQPARPGTIPVHPLERNFDLYYLNTCEHFTLILSPEDSETLIVPAALPYLDPSADRSLVEIFEAGHSAILAVLAAPQNLTLAPKLIPGYTDALFKSFPINLSPRQFRFAIRTLIQITAPPTPLSASQPWLPDTILELLHRRALCAPATLLPPALLVRSAVDTQSKDAQQAVSEQAVLVLALLDALPFLPCSSLEEWLPMAADLLDNIQNTGVRDTCKGRFWEVLHDGEMDIERAAVSVGWWTTRGGREKVWGESIPLGRSPSISDGASTRGGSRL